MAHSDILSQPDRGLGLDRPQTEALLALFSRCDDLREFGREVIQSVVNALMDSQAQEACGAPRGSRSPERVNSRNGYRERSLSTSLGDLELRVPSCAREPTSPRAYSSATRASRRPWSRSCARCTSRA